MFETQRLLLREYRLTDESFFIELFNDYDVLLGITTSYVAPSSERTREALKGLGKILLFMVAESKETGALVGFADINNVSPPQNLDGTIGIAIAKAWWGKGYGTEIMRWLVSYSFKTLGFRRLSLQVFASNPGAVALYEYVGFKHEGREREAIWREGEWVDLIRMGLLAREYYSDNTQAPQDVPENAPSESHPVSSACTQDGIASTAALDWVLL
ncbi:hypothetical protein HYPSUDRAFT_142022 [Hypholoma sublateritium FD-334 SS-4]|uniref:N-acetyltransferase domain-containing protein n=1 Tax=Hypholoma sublateritium (strain FD-334 SS-4) TaxID=945553 RepID=A0A0D2MAU8_HYPSF|nr:hypothetical protein HYPSUDRAFT_142022 [Hypholoma sublateritium FD-334 SS-4]